MTTQEYWLTNVLLEKGYTCDNGSVTGTLTELCHIRIKDGKIAEIQPADKQGIQSYLKLTEK